MDRKDLEKQTDNSLIESLFHFMEESHRPLAGVLHGYSKKERQCAAIVFEGTPEMYLQVWDFVKKLQH
jgi:hypothetical protein